MLTIPSYFDLDSVAIRWVDKLAGPELYVGNGKWEKYTDIGRVLMEGSVIPKPEFDSFLADIDEFLST